MFVERAILKSRCANLFNQQIQNYFKTQVFRRQRFDEHRHQLGREI